jgi:c-di-GMP-binding flagellar brake protein YcgR
MKESERRKFTRIPFTTEVKIVTDDREVFSKELENISLGGAMFRATSACVPAGTPCTFSVDLIGPASLLHIQVEAEVVRCDEQGIGVKFTKMDLDSLIHLRHFIKVYAQDPREINHEYFSNLVGIEQSEDGQS